MIEASVNGQPALSLKMENGNYFLDGQPVTWEKIQVTPSVWHVLLTGVSYRILITQVDREEKEVRLVINGKKAQVKLTTEMDRMLAKLGMGTATGKRAVFIKAPMPGMIYSIRVNEGDVVKKGDAVLILEAMKMENVIKAPGDGVIKQIHLKPGVTVEKGQLLITFV
jgi:biotin carboxyl carrier protein